VASRLDQTADKFRTQVNPDADLSAIQAAKDEFLKNNPNPIPVDQAQAMKVGTYRQLRSKYGQLGTATVEAQKSLALGIKEELEQQFPELKNLNAQDSKFINLDGPLNKAVQRMNNRNALPLSGPVAGAAVGAASGSGLLGTVAGVLKYVVNDPAMSSRLAIALNKAGVPLNIANARVLQYANALAASQKTEQPAQ